MTKNKDNNRVTPKTLTLDVEQYQHYLDECDMSETEKQEFTETMWHLVCEFIQLGFKIHPLQQGGSTFGKLPETGEHATLLKPDIIESDGKILTNHFKEQTEPETVSEEEGVTA